MLAKKAGGAGESGHAVRGGLGEPFKSGRLGTLRLEQLLAEKRALNGIRRRATGHGPWARRWAAGRAAIVVPGPQLAREAVDPPTARPSLGSATFREAESVDNSFPLPAHRSSVPPLEVLGHAAHFLLHGIHESSLLTLSTSTGRGGPVVLLHCSHIGRNFQKNAGQMFHQQQLATTAYTLQ